MFRAASPDNDGRRVWIMASLKSQNVSLWRRLSRRKGVRRVVKTAPFFACCALESATAPLLADRERRASIYATIIIKRPPLNYGQPGNASTPTEPTERCTLGNWTVCPNEGLYGSRPSLSSCRETARPGIGGRGAELVFAAPATQHKRAFPQRETPFCACQRPASGCFYSSSARAAAASPSPAAVTGAGRAATDAAVAAAAPSAPRISGRSSRPRSMCAP